MTLENTSRLSVPRQSTALPCIIRQTVQKAISRKDTGTISCCTIRQPSATISSAHGIRIVHTS